MIPLPDIQISTYENQNGDNFNNDEDGCHDHVNDTDQLLLDDTHLNIPRTYPTGNFGRGKSYPTPLMSTELRRFISPPVKESLFQFREEDEEEEIDDIDLLTSGESSASEVNSEEEAESRLTFSHQPKQPPQQCSQQNLKTSSIRRENRYSLAVAAEQFTMASLETECRMAAMKKQDSKSVKFAKSCVRMIIGKDKVKVSFIVVFEYKDTDFGRLALIQCNMGRGGGYIMIRQISKHLRQQKNI